MACGGDPFSVETYACALNLLPDLGDSMKYDLGLNLPRGAEADLSAEVAVGRVACLERV